MQLTVEERAMLAGRDGPAVRLAAEIVVAVAESQDATCLVEIVSGHIDGSLYHGQAGLDFARELVSGGGKVRVPTTLNVASLDLLHPELYKGEETTARAARSLMDAYVELGCRPTWTCAPYQLPGRPARGDQIAWGESNAIVFANSVLGARTNRYGDFLDICCALTGRAPFTGLHTDEGRRPKVVVDLAVPDHYLDSEIFYPVLGHLLGDACGGDVPAIHGLDRRADEDRLKALGAAAASSGALAMFHAVGVTPEASGRAALATSTNRRLVVGAEMLEAARASLSTSLGPVGAVSVGTPHMSLTELRSLGALVAGRESGIPFYVSTSRSMLDQAGDHLVAELRRFGATLVTDTCTYVAPIMGDIPGAVMTNSGKWAFYAPANLGVEVVLASLQDCVETAATGRMVVQGW